MANKNDLHVILGTGAVGLTVKDELCERGYTNIRMVNRSGKTSEPLSDSIELISGDVTDKAFAAQAAEGAAVVFNALNPAYNLWDKLIMPLWEGAAHAAVVNEAKLVVMDNLYMYGDTNGKPIHEKMPYKAHTKKGKIRMQAANFLHELHTSGKAQVVIVRASDFIGPRVNNSAMGGIYIFSRALQGKAVQVMGKTNMPHSYTYMPDVARALVDVAENDNTAGEVWHVPTATAQTAQEIADLIFAELGDKTKVSVLPKIGLWFAGLFKPEIRETREMMYEFEKPFIIDSSKFEKRFGWQPTPIETVVEESLTWFRAHAE